MKVPAQEAGVLTSTDVSGKTFRVALRGYAVEEVDAFLDLIEMTLREWETGRQGELKPRDVKQKTFRVALRGYAEEEVDRFLDEVVVSLREYESREIEKLSTPIEAPVAALVETPEVLQPPAPQPNIVIPTPTAATEPAETPKPTTPPPPTVPSTVTRLIVTRPGEKGGRPYTVLLDDQPIGKISPGATERFEIRPGMHWVTVKTRKEQSNNLVIEPHEGDQITLRCGPASGQIDDLGRRIEGIILETAE